VPTSEAIHHRPFFDSLLPAEADDLLARGRRRKYARGTALFYELQPSDHVVVLLDGRVKIIRISEEGKEVLLAVRGAGDLLGELSAIDGDARSATAVALEAVEGLVVATPEFHDFLERHARVSLELMKMLSRRLRDSDGKRLEYGSQDSMGRVAARLVELADRFGEADPDGVRIDLPITQEELAGWTGCSREAVSKALQGMRSLGWLETGRRTILVRDRDALCMRAGESG
jgi:CRP-like cAMP-binding protein